MGKSTSITPPLNQKVSHPVTRQIDPARAGQDGSVAPAGQPFPTDAGSRPQKPDRPQVPLSAEAVAGDSRAFGQTPAGETKTPQPVTPAVEVKTEH